MITTLAEPPSPYCYCWRILPWGAFATPHHQHTINVLLSIPHFDSCLLGLYY
jgi:hypothetical protein